MTLILIALFCVSVSPSLILSQAGKHAHTPTHTHTYMCRHTQTAATPLRKVMIHSSAHAHGVLTKALSLPRENPLLSMPDSLSACQGRKKYIDPAGGLAVSAALAAVTTAS